MKHNFIKSVMMLVLCLVFGTSAAHVIVVDNQLKSKMDAEYQLKNENTSSKKSEDSNLISVTCKLEGDASTYRPSGSVTISGMNFSEDFFASDDNKTIMCQIPAGNFDFIVSARLLANRKSTGAIVYSVKEQVNIQHDTTIVFNFAESTTRYDFQMFKPDGTQALLDVLQMSPDGLSADTISHGNINYLGLSANLILKGVGLVTGSRYQYYYENYGSYPCGTFFINDLSDRYKIGAYATFDDNENAYIAKLETSDMAETVIKNNTDGNLNHS